MKTITNVARTLKTNENFATLYKRTLELCDMTDFPEGTFTDDGNVWLELASVWEKFSECGEAGVFLDAAHRIMWGIPSRDYTPALDEIIRIVSEELLKDGEAFAAWDNYPVCVTSVDFISSDNTPCIENDEEYCYSIEHYQYLSDKMLWKIRYSKSKYAEEKSKLKEAALQYESVIKRIIPGAVSWTEEYWYNENHIYDEIVKLYGVDYRDDYVEYSRVLLTMMNPYEKGFRSDVYDAWFASNIRCLPFSLAEVIWPVNTEEKIIDMFLWASSMAENQVMDEVQNERKKYEIHPTGIFEYKSLLDSWMFPLVNAWYRNNLICSEDAPDVKTGIFNTSIKSI